MGRKRGRGKEGRLGSGLAGRVCPTRVTGEGDRYQTSFKLRELLITTPR